MDSDFSIFPSTKVATDQKKQALNDLTVFGDASSNDLLNFYSSSFNGLGSTLDPLEFPQHFDPNDPLVSIESQPEYSPPTLPSSSDLISQNFIPGLENDSTPGSSMSSLSPSSPSFSLYGPSSLADAVPKNTLSSDTSPNQQATPVEHTREKRKASVSQTESKKKSNTTSGTQKPPPRRPGRRIDPNEPENKRKAQNRAAQRAFRERKEQHLKELEDRVEELENKADTANNENEVLRKQVERLQAELHKYRNETTPSTSSIFSDSKFTFEFPFFQKPKSVSSETPMTDKSVSESVNFTGQSPENIPGLIQPTESLSSHEAEPKDDFFCDKLSTACGTKEDPVPKYKTANPFLLSDPEMADFTPDFLKTDNTSNLLSFDLDFLSDYKDQPGTDFLSTLDGFSSSDPKVDNILPTTDIDADVNSSSQSDNEDDTIPAPAKMMTCTAVWDRISSHPKFSEIDIDSLCSELRTKAKCSDTGVVLNESDVNKVLSSLP